MKKEEEVEDEDGLGEVEERGGKRTRRLTGGEGG